MVNSGADRSTFTKQKWNDDDRGKKVLKAAAEDKEVGKEGKVWQKQMEVAVECWAYIHITNKYTVVCYTPSGHFQYSHTSLLR